MREPSILTSGGAVEVPFLEFLDGADLLVEGLGREKFPLDERWSGYSLERGRETHCALGSDFTIAINPDVLGHDLSWNFGRV